jgi:hypothetical protein
MVESYLEDLSDNSNAETPEDEAYRQAVQFVKLQRKLENVPKQLEEQFQVKGLHIESTRQKKIHVFPLTLQTLIFFAYPKVFLTIFEQALLKSESAPCRN